MGTNPPSLVDETLRCPMLTNTEYLAKELDSSLVVGMAADAPAVLTRAALRDMGASDCESEDDGFLDDIADGVAQYSPQAHTFALLATDKSASMYNDSDSGSDSEEEDDHILGSFAFSPADTSVTGVTTPAPDDIDKEGSDYDSSYAESDSTEEQADPAGRCSPQEAHRQNLQEARRQNLQEARCQSPQ